MNMEFKDYVETCKYRDFHKEYAKIKELDLPITAYGYANKSVQELINDILEFTETVEEENNMPLKIGFSIEDIIYNKPQYIYHYGGPMTSGAITMKKTTITNVEIYNERVVKVTFSDGSFTKAVCSANDTFSLDVGITVCLIKKMMGGSNQYNNLMRDIHKFMDQQQEEKIAQQKREQDIRKKKLKAAKKRLMKKEKSREEAINIQKEAYKRAMMELTEVKPND